MIAKNGDQINKLGSITSGEQSLNDVDEAIFGSVDSSARDAAVEVELVGNSR